MNKITIDELEIDNNVNFLKIQKETIIETMLYLREHYEMSQLVDIFVIDNMNESSESRFCLNYFLKNLSRSGHICVQFEFDENDLIESVSELWPNAIRWEEEIKLLFGINLNFINNSKFLIVENGSFPMRKDFKDKEFIYDFENEKFSNEILLTPTHYLQKNDIEIAVQVNDSIVTKSNLLTGYQFRGIEKQCEHLNVEQISTFSDRWNPNKSIFYNVLWNDTLEKLFQIKIPERAMAIRMILLELNRIKEHCFMIAMISYELKFQKYYSLMMLNLEKINGLIKFYTGDRTSTSFACMGGVRNDLPAGWTSTCITILDSIEQELMDFSKVLNNSTMWNLSLSVGKISSIKAIEWGLSGPNLRASGINFDLRKKSPYYFYKDVNFEVPIGQEGKVVDRYLVRFEEIIQSIKIIMQVLDNIPSGEMLNKEVKSFRAFKNGIFVTDEKLFKDAFNNQLKIPHTQFYNSMESSDGEIGIHLKGNDSFYPQRLKIFSSSTNALSIFSEIIKEQNVSDLLLIYASLNINMKDVER